MSDAASRYLDYLKELWVSKTATVECDGKVERLTSLMSYSRAKPNAYVVLMSWVMRLFVELATRDRLPPNCCTGNVAMGPLVTCQPVRHR